MAGGSANGKHDASSENLPLIRNHDLIFQNLADFKGRSPGAGGGAAVSRDELRVG